MYLLKINNDPRHERAEVTFKDPVFHYMALKWLRILHVRSAAAVLVFMVYVIFGTAANTEGNNLVIFIA